MAYQYQYQIHGEPQALLEKLFSFDDGALRFGAWSARTKETFEYSPNISRWTPFIDYIMERHVAYELRAVSTQDGVVIEIRGDNDVGGHVDGFTRWSLRQLALEYSIKITAPPDQR